NLSRHSLGSPTRLRGYRAALDALGAEVDEALIQSHPGTVEAGRRALLELLALPHPPTAVVVTANLQTVGVVKAMAELELRVPRALSVVGFGHNGFDFWPAVPLTMIARDANAVGQEAARLLLDRLNGPAGDGPRRVILACELEICTSTGPPPARPARSRVAR